MTGPGPNREGARRAPFPGLFGRGRKGWEPGRNAFWLLIPPGLLLLVFFVLPLATMIFGSFETSDGQQSAYLRLIGSASLRASLIYTVVTAFEVTLVVLILAYPVAFLLSALKGQAFALCMVLVLVPFWTSAVIRSYAWTVILQRRGVLNDLLMQIGVIDRPFRFIGSDLGLQIAMVHLMLPFMILPLLNTLRGIDHVYLRAASVLGANPFRQFRHILLPMSLPGITAGCALVFITSLGFYIAPALLGGSGTMIAVMMDQQASKLLDWPMASALGTILLVGTSLLFMVYERAMRRGGAA